MVLKVLWFSFKHHRPFVYVQVAPEAVKMDQSTTLVSKLIHKGEQLWEKYSTAPPNTLRHALYSLGTRLMARLPPQEYQFRQLHNLKDPQGSLECCREMALQPARIIAHLGREGERHKWWWRLHAGLSLPVTVLTVLPGVKAVLAWILFRAITHWRALQGIRKVTEAINQGRLLVKHNSMLDDVKRAEDYASIQGIVKDEHLLNLIGQHLKVKRNRKDQ